MIWYEVREKRHKIFTGFITFFVWIWAGIVKSYGVASGLAVRRWTGDHLGRWFESHHGYLRNNLGQVVHTYVPLSPSSITWYWSEDRDVLRLGS